jgi:hypothetical protein
LKRTDRYLNFGAHKIGIIATESKKQRHVTPLTTALFLSTIVTRTRRHTEQTKKKLTNLMGNLYCAREHSVQFFMQFFYTVKQHTLTAYGAPKNLKAQNKILLDKIWYMSTKPPFVLLGIAILSLLIYVRVDRVV